MTKLLRAAIAVAALVGVTAGDANAQQIADETTVFDSIAVRGASQTGRDLVIGRVNIALGQPIGFLDIQRAIEALFASDLFVDVRVLQGVVGDKQVLVFEVVERPILRRWDITGVSRLPERSVRGKVRMLSGRPFNAADAHAAVSAIDSLYKREGYYQTQVVPRTEVQEDGSVIVVFDLTEGSRVAVSRVIIEGNEAFEAGEIVGAMRTSPSSGKAENAL